jgi:TonB family protein
MKRERVHLPAKSSADSFHGADDNSTNNFLANSLEERPIWAGLYENLRDALFPSRLPPLELTSTPIPTPDRMAVKTNPWAIGSATIANGSILAMLFLMGLNSALNHPPKSLPGSDVHLKDFTLFAPPRAQAAHGGGSGGANDLIDPIVGRLPRQDMIPIVPPQIPIVEHPILAIDPAIAVPPEIKLPDNPSLPNIGVHNSTNVTLVSAGQGGPAGIGSNPGHGVGPGRDDGYGPGFDRGVGGGPYSPGTGGVSNPIPIVTPEAEFSEEARRVKYQGVCTISLIVDAHGYPQNLRVIRSLGMGLDEKALEAVLKYRFKPATKDGKPVPVFITVEVNFRLY